jgi:hypothetical protein
MMFFKHFIGVSIFDPSILRSFDYAQDAQDAQDAHDAFRVSPFTTANADFSDSHTGH